MFTSSDGRLMVRCFSQNGDEFADYDLSVLTMAPGLKDALTAAFVKRTAPGAGLTSLHSTEKNYWSLVQFDRYLRTLPWPPREVSHLTPGHIDGFYETRKHLPRAVRGEISDLKQLLIRTDGISSPLAGRLAAPLPPKPPAEPKEGYSRAEFKRIADAARGDLRAAAQRIRANRDLLHRFRQGEVEIGNDRILAERLELLDCVDRFGDVPRKRRESGRDAGTDVPLRWISRNGHGSAPEVVSWLHLTAQELVAGAILLGVLTGENPDVIFKAPAAHHRADGYTGRTGTTIVDLVKPRRGPRAYMNLALSQVPDWISIPDQPEEMTTRDELHTPFGLYTLLHELTVRSRALAGGNLLLVGYCASGGREQGRGLRPINRTSGLIGDRASAWGLMKDEPDDDGKPVPLTLTLSLLRLTYIELHQRPVAHTEKTAATQYLLRNRGNVTEYRKVVAAALTEEAAKARARGSVSVMSADDVERTRTDPEAVAFEHGLDPMILKKMVAGELDTVMTACTDNKNSPHAPSGTPCPASFMLCLDCECARALPRHLPIQVLVHDRLSERREQMDALQWARRFAGPLARLADLLAEADEAAVADARRDATDADRALVERFLNRELDLR
ncbi:hypothetical protein ACIQZN_05570 [Streptomyces sp. NPDC097595]|uniref:hypothetical protein n=1 Tax=Streptomyces sp. NPDC097595 TaxID=3366090 RepID=UPI003803A57A